MSADLLQDVHFPQNIVTLVAFLQHELEGVGLFASLAGALEHNTVLASTKRSKRQIKNECLIFFFFNHPLSGCLQKEYSRLLVSWLSDSTVNLKFANKTFQLVHRLQPLNYRQNIIQPTQSLASLSNGLTIAAFSIIIQ